MKLLPSKGTAFAAPFSRFIVARVLQAVVAAIVLAATPNGWSVPASSEPGKVRQPNGVEVTLRLRGDEWFSWTETLDGRPVIKHPNNGFWTYAKQLDNGELVSTGRRVGIDKPNVGPFKVKPSAKKQETIVESQTLASRAAAPNTGTGLVPVILATFSDRTPVVSVNTISNLLFNTSPGAKSMATYYTEVSYGKFTVASGPSGVRGWYTVPNTHDFYGGDLNSSIKDTNAALFVRHAVLAAIANGYDFSPYDQDGDGKVDVVNIVHAGAGQEVVGADTNNIWSHRFSLSSANIAPVTNANGLVIDDYVIQPELSGNGSTTTPIKVGVFVHEHGHALGLPDLYDSDYSSEGIGNWSGMSFGANLSGGATPAHFDAWCKMKLGWVTPINYTLNSQNVEFPCAATSSFAARLWKDGVAGSQYYLVENRFRTNFDSAIPSDGLLIWHIDESKSNNKSEWYPGRTNSGNYLVALVQADGQFHMENTNSPSSNQGDGGDPFPGTSNNRLFDYSSSPNSRAYNTGTTPGYNSYVVVSNISNAGPLMTADIYTRSPNSGPYVEWVNIGGVVPPYEGALFTKLDDYHPVVIKALPGNTGTALKQVQLYIGRSSDGLWWDFPSHNWTTNPISSNVDISGVQANGFTLAYQNNLPSGTNLLNGGYTFIVRVINTSDIVTELQMPMTAQRQPEVSLTLTDNAIVNTLTNFNAIATEDSGVGIHRVEVALYYDTEAYDIGGGGRYYWDGYNWTTTPLWLGADFNGNPAQATLLYPIGPDASHLQSDREYTIVARAIDGFGSEATNSITVMYDTGIPPTYYWRYASSGSWSDPANWTPYGIPGSGDHVAINARGDYTVSIYGNVNAASLRFGRVGGLSKQNLNIVTGSLTITGSETNKFFPSAVLTQGANLTAGKMRFFPGSTWNWTNGTLSAQADLDVDARLYFDGDSDKTIYNGIIGNNGSMVWRGKGNILMHGGTARINNLRSFSIENDQLFIDSDYYDYTPPVVFNSGVFRKYSGTNTVLASANQGITFTNIGFVQVDSGTLTFNGETHLGNGGMFLGSGKALQHTGNLTAYGTNTILSGAQLQIKEALVYGYGAFTGGGSLLFTNGASYRGNITILQDSTLELSSTNSVMLWYDSALTNRGTIKWLNGNIASTRNRLVNEGLFLARCSTGVLYDFDYYDYVPAEFYNFGTFQKDVVGTNEFQSANEGYRFHNLGTLDVTAGKILLNGGGSSTNGVYHPGAAGTVEFKEMTHELYSNSHFDVDGTLRITGATVTQYGVTHVINPGGMLEVTNGVLNGVGAVTGGNFYWRGGTLGGTNVIAASATMYATGNDTKSIARYSTLLNYGSIYWTGGDIAGSAVSVIRNEGLFDAQSNQTLTDYDYYDYVGATFENVGTLRKSASVGVTTFSDANQGFTLTNRGAINVQSGVLSFRSGTQLGNGGTFSGAGVASQDANTVTIFGTNTIAAGGRFRLAESGMAGMGAFNGNGDMVWTNNARLYGNLTIMNGLSLDFVATNTVYLSYDSVLNNAGTINWESGDVSNTRNILRNTGTFIARSPLGKFVDWDYYDYVPAEFFNLGTFLKPVAGTNEFWGGNQGTRFHNCGTVNVQAGEVQFDGGGSSTNGTFTAGANGSIQFGGLDHYLYSGSHFDVSGLVRIVAGSVTQYGVTHTVQAGGNIDLAGGTLGGVGSFGGAGVTIWGAGTLSGTNTILSGARLDISGSAARTLGDYSRLVNNGTATWTGTGNIAGGALCVIENNSLFDVQNDAAIYDGNYYDYVGCSFINNGTFRKKTATGTTRIASDNQGFSFANNGTLDVKSGTVQFESGFSQGLSSTLQFTIGGYTAGTNYGRIVYTGNMPLSGQVAVTLTNDFMPTNGGSFSLVGYNAHSGQFSTVTLPTLTDGSDWRSEYLSSGFRIYTRPTPTCSPAADGLVAWWPGNGDVNMLLTGDLVATNGATNSLGLNGQAFDMNGSSQYWTAPDSPALRPTNFTMEGWVNFADASNLRVLFGKPYGDSYFDSYQVWMDYGTLRAGITTAEGFNSLLSYSWAPTAGTWHHVAFSYDQTAKTSALYVDGAAVANTTNAPGPVVYDSRPFIVGADIEYGSPNYFFNGQIDEVALYNRALSSNEVASIFSAEAVGRCPVVVETKFVLSKSVLPVNGGTIQVSPASTNGYYTSNSIVTLTAVPANGMAFSGWSGAVVSTNNPVQITMSTNRIVTATFTNIPARYLLTKSVSPLGGGTINVNPPSTNGYYASNTVVTLTAVPATGKAFAGWSGAVVSKVNPLSITMNTNKSVIATFTNAPVSFLLSKSVTPLMGGTITVTPVSTNNYYASNTIVTLTANANAGYKFVRWSGASTAITNRISLVMNGNKTISAVFTNNTVYYGLTKIVTPAAAGAITASPFSSSNMYPAGTIVTVTASPSGTNVFSAWLGAVTGITNRVNVTMNSSKSVTALFNNPGKFVFQNTNGQLAVWFMQNTNRLATIAMNNSIVGWRLAAAADFNNNKFPDLLFHGANGQTTLWMLSANNLTNTMLLRGGYIMGSPWRLAAAADLNKDGKTDILWQNTNNFVLNTWLMNGVTYVTNRTLAYTVTAGWRAIATANFDTNSSPDILFQNATGQMAVWLMNGLTRTANVTLNGGVSPGTAWVAVGATDVDANGKMDIVFQRSDGALMVWFMNGTAFVRSVLLPNTIAPPWMLRALK